MNGFVTISTAWPSDSAICSQREHAVRRCIERRSVVITSNLVFSQWDRIFKDPMTTAAAIDRLVHHAIILEMTGPSRRSEEAKKRSARKVEKEADEG